MKCKALLIPLISIFLVSCGGNSDTTNEENNNNQDTSGTSFPSESPIESVPLPSDDDYVYPNRHGQDTPILHCFNWSINNISSKLDDIKESGFKAIQLSPLQPQKDPQSGNWKNQWWKLYQPMGFSISTSTSQNQLGSKADLISLCSKAKEKDIDVIVDIVANHLGGGSSQSLNGNVRNYEQKIYDDQLIHKLGRGVSDTDVEALLRGHMGEFPDLKTENAHVQERVLSLLKEYIDCGISGFRFDATKHIETPDDGTYASSFWPTILNGATNYAISKGKSSPYYYGEVLYTVGKGRSVDSYTKYMSLTDNEHGNKVRKGIERGLVNATTPSYYIPNDKAVLWAESHDTYSNDSEESTYTTIEEINKTYVIEASRQNASTLYLSRPKDNLGDIGDLSYEMNVVKAINNFHNICADFDEKVETRDGYFINQRNRYGAVIVNVSGASSATIDLPRLKDGRYVNLINNQTVNIENGKADISFISDCSILLFEDFAKIINAKPKIEIGNYKEIFKGSQTIDVKAYNADSLTYQINNGETKSIINDSITLDSSLSNGAINLKITASNQIASEEKILKLIKTNLADYNHIFINCDTTYSNMIWNWQGFNDGSWADVSVDGNMLGFNNGNNDRYMVVKFPLGTTKDSANWNNALYQTDDLDVPSEKIIDYSTLTFKVHN